MRRSIVITAAVALTLGLAACGSENEEPEETTPEATQEPEETTAADGGALTIWVDDTREAAVAAAAETFEADTGTTVELVQKNFDDIRPDLLAQVPTGEGPDITVGAHDWLGELTANGVVAPVELGDKAGEFEDVAVEAFTYEGQVYGLPYAIENIAIYRNTALVDETPATFDEMIAMGEESGAEYPFLVQITEVGDPYTMYPFQTSFGAPVFETNADGSYTAELALGGENGNAFAQWLAEQGEAGTLNTSWEYDIVVEAFANGEAAYLLGGPWMLASFEGVDVAVDPIPSAGGEPAQPFTGVQGFYVSAQSDNALLATDFLVNYMATEEAQIALYEAGDRTPALTAAADTVSEDPVAAGFREVGTDAVPMPSIPEMGEVWNFWGVTEGQIISGQLDPVEGWEKMVADIQAAIGG
ncbi:carbohydrate ABC transporter substrate-binding protein, CUT1 family [Georgenia satyanarayanai]|uniref:Carbohydrate ABC transporter substrate-binding protein, CUT1 family n=1 Tax=Georgenia satyanarayanai TaxID=860221 RepID=A0A2Y8ZWX4_9MICO|nr:extracellular solute-binding protein [Georgenia satyanarayanai]PYG01665.1 carbohydrate ABC transporter substrate-binding protein (CUT1 family) [Georgenia satyanarayanai]SSA36465.1 carbohydrate ABC transporter substrate-binding protein, CUT1 family [Georgenia satyanarayanai]